MHYVMVLQTRNSIYTVTRVHGAAYTKVQCQVGTFQGTTWYQTRAQYRASDFGLDDQGNPTGRRGKILTEDGPIEPFVQSMTEFGVSTYEERCREQAEAVYGKEAMLDDLNAYLRV